MLGIGEMAVKLGRRISVGAAHFTQINICSPMDIAAKIDLKNMKMSITKRLPTTVSQDNHYHKNYVAVELYIM